MKRFTQWASREYSSTARMLAMLPAGILFIYLIPFALVKLVPRLDALFHLPRFAFGLANIIVGFMLVIGGALFAFWSIASQFSRARGTPLPMMATQTLLIDGPFKYCRNPMAFGTFLLYGGISILAGSICSILVVILFAALLLTYIRRVEERELEARFGAEYLVYKANTPFIIPRIFRRKHA